MDYIADTVSAILQQYDISYVKWDFNRHISDPYSLGLDASAAKVEGAVSNYLAGTEKSGLPHEFGGTASCTEVGDLVLRSL